MPQGQSPSAEDSQSLSDLIDGMLSELEARDVLFLRDTATFDDKYLQPLGHILAWRAAPEYGAASDQALAALATQAEIHLRNMESARYTYQIGENTYF